MMALSLRQAVGAFFAREVTNIKGLDIVFESIPRLLVTNYQMLDDEAEHGNGTTVIIKKTSQI
jgi:hypothetical protein